MKLIFFWAWVYRAKIWRVVIALFNIHRCRIIVFNQLITTNSVSTSGLNTNHPMYKEFLDFMQAKQKKGWYSSNLFNSSHIYEESTKIFDQNNKKEVILLLEYSDLRWKNDPWQLMSRCLDSVYYTTPALNIGCIMRWYS